MPMPMLSRLCFAFISVFVWLFVVNILLTFNNQAWAQPTAINDNFSMVASTSLTPNSATIDVLTNDTGDATLAVQDPPGTPTPSGSTAVDGPGPGNNVIYTPVDGFIGTVTFSYTAVDGSGNAAATVTGDVTNQAPTPQDDSDTTAFQTPVIIDVLTNDSDPDGHGLQIQSVGSAGNGSTVDNGDGTVTYTPDNGFSGTDTFSYTVNDTISPASATVIVTVDPQVLVAVDDSAITAVNTPVVVDVLSNDSGSPITISSVGSATNGSTVDNGDGTVTYTPNIGFSGPDSFTYTITDGVGSDTATVNITVTVPTPVIAVDDSATTISNTDVTINVLSNDLGDLPLSVASVSTAGNGSTVDNGDGTITYTPNIGFSGLDSFTYTATDGFTNDTATVTITVSIIDPVIAVDDNPTTDANTSVSIDVLTNDSGGVGPLNIVSVSGASDGIITDNGSSVTYTPNDDFSGTDSFTYTVTDGFTSDTATVNITVFVVANDDNEFISPGVSVTIDVLNNDAGTNLSIIDVEAPNIGVATIDGDEIIYTPNSDVVDGTDLFDYTVTDGINTATATVRVTITDNLEAVDDLDLDINTTPANQPLTIDVLDNDIGTSPVISDVAEPSHGTAGNVGGLILYTPDLNYSGTDSFEYTITNGSAFSTATVNLIVTVVATDDSVSTAVGAPINIDVLNDDIGSSLSIASFEDASNGTVDLNSDGTFTYTPNPNVSNIIDTFSYTITDGTSNDTATVSVSIGSSPLPTVTITTTSDAFESNLDSGTFLVSINTVATDDLVIEYTVSGSATPEVDYERLSETVIITAGSSNRTIEVIPLPDDEEEETETVEVTLLPGDGFVLGNTNATVSIFDDEEPPPPGDNEGSVGAAAMNSCNSATATADFMRDCQSMTDSVIDAVTPEAASTSTEVAETAAEEQAVNVRTRLFSIRRGGRTNIDIDNLRFEYNGWAVTGEQMQRVLEQGGGGAASDQQSFGSGRLGGFISGTIDFGDRDGTVNQDGFEFSTYGLTAGLDYRFTEQLVLGAALTFSTSETDVDANGGNLDSEGYGVTLYGTYYMSEKIFFDATLGYGRYNYDQQRHLNYQTNDMEINQTFDTEYDGSQLTIDVSGGYEFVFGELLVTPTIRLSYVDVEIDEFHESARNNNPGSAWAVAIESQQQDSLTASVGTQASYVFRQSWGLLIPKVELEWIHEFYDDSQIVTGHFIEAGDNANNVFHLTTDPLDSDYFSAGAGVTARWNNGATAVLQYRRVLGYENLDEHAINVLFRWQF